MSLPVPFQLENKNKNKKQIFEEFHISSMKRQRIKVIKVGTFENINQTKLKWFTSMRATEY